MKFAFDWDEVQILIHELQQRGISYLVGAGPFSPGEDHIDSVRLIQRLASCGYPLVENASIALFILHPELAPAVKIALQESEGEVAEELAVLILATLYHQQWWSFRFTNALGRLPSFPEEPFKALWEERNLPPPSAGYGRDGLYALQEYQQQRYKLPLNFLDDWQNQINHLLAQEEAYQRQLPDDLQRQLSDNLKKIALEAKGSSI